MGRYCKTTIKSYRMLLKLSINRHFKLSLDENMYSVGRSRKKSIQAHPTCAIRGILYMFHPYMTHIGEKRVWVTPNLSEYMRAPIASDGPLHSRTWILTHLPSSFWRQGFGLGFIVLKVVLFILVCNFIYFLLPARGCVYVCMDVCVCVCV